MVSAVCLAQEELGSKMQMQCTVINCSFLWKHPLLFNYKRLQKSSGFSQTERLQLVILCNTRWPVSVPKKREKKEN